MKKQRKKPTKYINKATKKMQIKTNKNKRK
jgi:hypothetical protein